MKDKRYWHPTKRDPAFQRQIERGFQALYPDLGRDATGRQRRGEPRNDLAFDGKGNVVPFQNVSADSASLNSASGDGEVRVRAYTQSRDGETVQVAQHTRSAPGNGPGDGADSTGTRKSDPHANLPEPYRKLMAAAGIDIDANADKAEKMSLREFLEAIPTRGPWDYKNVQKVKDAAEANGVSRDDLQRFGNFHFGYMANAFGFGLGRTLSGAGLYQAFDQGGGSKSEAIAGAGYGLSKTQSAQFFTDNGFTWGDNPGDSKDIMEGWLHYENTRRKATQ
ncbi:polymorphic toxin type 44 domain-containing protein [Ferrovibrio sp.]|uniref:polymorphic toxin type 44 domain-containing protein n=1 Tax=Ferrovibrio sp. TaxID=1917215 RepID=UPI0025B8BF5B|nr:polymorphic toxin type 44 domain-containing protein [Ferrovibrio sp.]MBX3454578.1 hypothetical protein [Ferrovibrio sp.]